MPLDDESRALLTLIDSWDTVSLETDPIDEVRARGKANLLTLIVPGEPVARVQELSVSAGGRSNDVRAYWPRLDASALPALLVVHGGGWAGGSLDHVDAFCRTVAMRADCAVMSMDYRLAPEHPYPAALEDLYAALEWLVERADELGVDAARIGLCGESAGGNLAAALTLMAAQRGGPAIACQSLLCPVLDASMSQPSIKTFAAGYTLESEQLAWMWDTYRAGAPASDPLVSPLAASLEAPLPPTSIHVAECDPLRDEAIAYAAKLAAAGTDVRLRCWPGQLHAFQLFTKELSIASLAVDEIARELKQLLDVPALTEEAERAAR